MKTELIAYLKRRYSQLSCLVLQGQGQHGRVADEAEEVGRMIVWLETEEPQCEGDHFFENRCATCGGSQPDGPCEVCPHIGPQQVCSAEHFARRPCRHCGSSNLRTVRVRAPRTT